MRQASLVIFSDIDGTLIDFETYDYAAVEPVVSRLVAEHIPLVLCSSKTRSEQAYYRQVLEIPDAFIVENGSAIVVPQDYFTFDFGPQRSIAGYDIIELGVSSATIRRALAEIREETALTFLGTGDVAIAEISRLTGLGPVEAQRVREREYSETIVTPLTPTAHRKLKAALRRRGLMLISGGRFHTVTSVHSDKGSAVILLSQLLRRKLGPIVTVGLGDSANDQPMLAAVDRAFLVQGLTGDWADMPGIDVERIPGVGPAGWRQAIGALLSN